MEEEVIATPLLSNHELVNETTSIWSSLTFKLVFSYFVILFGSFICGVTIGFTSPAESQILDDLGLSLAQYSFFGSIATIGHLIGAASCGKITDAIGRQGSAWSLDLGRFLMGIATGVISYVVPVYVAEIAPKDLREAFISVSPLMSAVGISSTYIIGSLLHWRTLALISTVPFLIQFTRAFFIPESSRWLAKVGREEELEVALKQLMGKHVDISHEGAKIIDFSRNCDQIAEDGIKVLFERKCLSSYCEILMLVCPRS